MCDQDKRKHSSRATLKVIGENRGRSIRCATFSDLSTKDLPFLGQYTRFFGSRGSILSSFSSPAAVEAAKSDFFFLTFLVLSLLLGTRWMVWKSRSVCWLVFGRAARQMASSSCGRGGWGVGSSVAPHAKTPHGCVVVRIQVQDQDYFKDNRSRISGVQRVSERKTTVGKGINQLCVIKAIKPDFISS